MPLPLLKIDAAPKEGGTTATEAREEARGGGEDLRFEEFNIPSAAYDSSEVKESKFVLIYRRAGVTPISYRSAGGTVVVQVGSLSLYFKDLFMKVKVVHDHQTSHLCGTTRRNNSLQVKESKFVLIYRRAGVTPISYRSAGGTVVVQVGSLSLSIYIYISLFILFMGGEKH
eukprot:gene9557-6713_t